MSDFSQAREPSRLWFPFAHEIVRSRTWSRLSKIAKAVYPVIAAFADFKTGENSFPSISTITKHSGIARSSVFLALKELSEYGLVEVTQRGDVTGSNRYRIVLWPRTAGGPMAALPGPENGRAWSDEQAGGGPIDNTMPVRPPNPTYNPVIINQITTTTTERGRGGGSLELVLETLGLKNQSARNQLERMAERFTVDWIRDACDEAVAQGRPTLKYLSGILRNWEREGRVVRLTRSEANRAETSLRKTRDRSSRAAEEDRAARSRGAYEQTRARLATCTPDEIASWKKEAYSQAQLAGLSGYLAEAFTESAVLRLAANKFGIEGL